MTIDAFPPLKRQLIDFDFNGGCVTDSAGTLLLRSIDKRLQLTEKIAAVLPDSRDIRKVQHNTEQLLRQRIYALASGDEDLNDHNELRHDIAIQTAIEAGDVLASTATMQRFE